MEEKETVFNKFYNFFSSVSKITIKENVEYDTITTLFRTLEKVQNQKLYLRET